MNPLSELLAGRDRWTGAACIGEWELFDPRGDDEPAELFSTRLEYARAYCRACPVLEKCHETAQAMPATHRAGIWAGTVFDSNGRPTGGPK